MKKVITYLSVLGSLSAAPAFASGYICDSAEGLRIKLYNHVQPTNGTRNPAILVISSDEGTLLKRSGEEIEKQNLPRSTRYVVEGNSALRAERAVLRVDFKDGDGRVSEDHEINGTLVLVREG